MTVYIQLKLIALEDQIKMMNRKTMSAELFRMFLVFAAVAEHNVLGLYEIPYDAGSDICQKIYDPSSCRLPIINLDSMKTVEDFDRCAPALLNKTVREFFLAATGRRITYTSNLKSFRKIQLIPRVLRDVSNINMETTVLGQKIAAPIGTCPVAALALAHPDAESGVARATAKKGVVMILSVSASQSLESVAEAVRRIEFNTMPLSYQPVLWMQTYMNKLRADTIQVIRRAEASGFKAIVITVDTPKIALTLCGEKEILNNLTYPNKLSGALPRKDYIDASATFRDLAFLTKETALPILVKGILNSEDAVTAAYAGASAIIVSNHGGRQLDGAPPAIDVLPEIATTIKSCCPNVEVYMDSGVRSGYDVFKAIAAGARAVFIGRPTAWGLAVGGEEGVTKMLSILEAELKEDMELAGASTLSQIGPHNIFEQMLGSTRAANTARNQNIH